MNDLLHIDDWSATAQRWLTSPQFYVQLGAIAAAIALGWVISLFLKSKIVPKADPERGPSLFPAIQGFLLQCRPLIWPLMNIILLGVAAKITFEWVEKSWLVRIAQSLSVVSFMYVFITRFISSPFIVALLKYVGIPIATLRVFGRLDEVVNYLDAISIHVGTILISLYDLGRSAFFGAILFWLGRISASTGKRVIRSQPQLDVGTREVMAKLFEVVLFIILFVLLLQVAGIELTTLAVFGGALALGLGFGFQNIAANFVAGIIILLDRSITLDDYIELEDGRAGRIRELNMRCATLETFDGKDIVVPNETFISTTFTNWTHSHKKQRYTVTFSVSYSTDIPRLIELVTDVVRSHPQVLSGPDMPPDEQAAVEIDSFGDSGINMLVEYWMEGIDDGANSVDADLRLMIWTALRANGIEMPFPQREVRILGGKA